MKQIGKGNTLHFLAARHRHDEIDIGDFEQDKSKDTYVE